MIKTPQIMSQQMFTKKEAVRKPQSSRIKPE
jgi:hypothetical protein